MVTCLLVFTVVCIVCSEFFLVSFIYTFFLLVLSVLPPSDNSIVNNNSTLDLTASDECVTRPFCGSKGKSYNLFMLSVYS
jgi:hypothetical protein